MPPRSNPTARQVRLGTELRKLREAVGMSAREAGDLLGGDQTKISHIESGRWGVSAERVMRLASNYSATDDELIDALCAMAEERGKGWWAEYRGILPPGFLDIAELEFRATYLRSLHALTIPGIFQTEDYARTIFRDVIPALSESEIEARIGHRVRRREIFKRDSPPPYELTVHEAALRMRFGGRKVAKAQLEYLLEVSEWPSVTLRVIPFSAERFIGSAQTVLYAGGPVPQLDTVQLDAAHTTVFLDTSAELDNYRATHDALIRVSLDVDESRDSLRSIIQEL